MSTLEDLLRTTYVDQNTLSKKAIEVTPDFRVAVQRITPSGVHFIIHAASYDSDTLDFVAVDDGLYKLGEDIFWDHENNCFVLTEDRPFL